MQVESKKAMDELGYEAKWVDYGFLDEETLRRQWMIYQTGEDRVTEHYRYAAFCQILDGEGLTTPKLVQLVGLVSREKDEETAESMRRVLIWWPKLADDQRAALRTEPLFATGRLQREFAIFDLSRELHASTTISDDLSDRCFATGDETLQRQMVEHPGVTVPQLEVLIDRGKSKAVRNMAQSRIKRMERAADADTQGAGNINP
jgi:hypothetical protein